MVWAKFVLCLILAVWAHAGLIWAARRPDEIGLLRRFVVGAVILKFVAVAVLYALRPQLGATSDAGLYYIHEARHVLAGEVPYRDFDSSYSPLFPVILAPAVAVWNGIGAIVLLMTAFEAAMLGLYLRASPAAGSVAVYRTAFYYSFSPISVYWCALTGYNGSIIALFALASLLLAERRRDAGAATVAVAGFLCSKLLMALNFPAFICFERRGCVVRGAILVGLAAAAIGGPYLAGFDTLLPIRREMNNVTSGNIWFLLAPLVSEEIRRTPAWNLAPLFAFALVFPALFVPYASKMWRSADRGTRFNSATAFLATTNLLFMILSKKSYGFYLLMTLLFVVHTVVVASGDLRSLGRRLVPLTFLGAVATTQDRLWMIVRDQPLTEPTSELAILWLLDAAVVSCYAYLLLICYRTCLQYLPTGVTAVGPRPASG